MEDLTVLLTFKYYPTQEFELSSFRSRLSRQQEGVMIWELRISLDEEY